MTASATPENYTTLTDVTFGLGGGTSKVLRQRHLTAAREVRLGALPSRAKRARAIGEGTPVMKTG